MILHLFRHLTTPQARGYLIANGSIFAATLEDAVRDLSSPTNKVQGKTAIPAGRYQIQVSFSQRFQKKTIEVLNVPNFSGVRIHAVRDLVVGGDAVDTNGCPGLLPAYPGSKAGPALTDALTGMIEHSPGQHFIEIVDGWQG